MSKFKVKVDSGKLDIPASAFYWSKGVRLAGNRLKKKIEIEKLPKPDAAGLELLRTLCVRQYMAEAKQHNFMRRVYNSNYIHRCDDGKMMTLDNFEQLGPRWAKEHHEILPPHDGHTGWYTDDFGETLTGVVLCFTRGGSGGMDGNDQFDLTKPKGRVIYMAGTKHSDWEGVTLYLKTTDDPKIAALWADQMAEHEAETCREEFEKDRLEQEEAEKLEAAVEEEHFV